MSYEITEEEEQRGKKGQSALTGTDSVLRTTDRLDESLRKDGETMREMLRALETGTALHMRPP
jgi:hypothetical protein